MHRPVTASSIRAALADAVRDEREVIGRSWVARSAGRPFTVVASLAAALLLAIVGRAVFTPWTAEEHDARRLLLRVAAVTLVGALAVMAWRGFGSFVVRLRIEAERPVPSLRHALLRTVVRRAFVVVLPTAAAILALFLGFATQRPLLVLYAAELTLVFLVVALGIFTVSLRLWVDFARRAEAAPGLAVRVAHQVGCVAAGALYAWGMWRYLRPHVGEALLTGLVLGGALLLLGLNRSDVVDRETVERITGSAG